MELTSSAPLPSAQSSAEQPDLAVIVIGFGAPPQLITAVESVLTQSTPVEVVVVNSAGGDAKGLLAGAGINVRTIEFDEPLFVGAARNHGIRMTKAPWVAFLASDCVAPPDWAAERLRLHREGAEMVASAMMPDRPDSVVAWAHHLLLFPLRLPALPSDRVIHYGISFRRRLFDIFGLFDDTLQTAEDTEYLQRTAAFDQPVWAPKVITVHRSVFGVWSLLCDQAVRGYRAGHVPQHVSRRSQLWLIRETLRIPKVARRAARAALAGETARVAARSLWLVRLGSLARVLGRLAAQVSLRTRRPQRCAQAEVAP